MGIFLRGGRKARSVGDTPARQPVLVNLEASGLERVGVMGTRMPMVVVYKRRLSAKSGAAGSSGWTEVGRTECVNNRVNPKFLKCLEFDAAQSSDVLLRFEVFATDAAMLTRTMIGCTETSLPLALKSEGGVLEVELEDDQTGELTGALLTVMAHRVVPMRQRELVLDITWKGFGMIGEGSKVICFRRIPGVQNRYTPVYVSETLSKAGTFKPMVIPGAVLAEGLKTHLMVSFNDVASTARMAVLEAPIDALLGLDLARKDFVWHDDIRVDIPRGSIVIPGISVDDRCVRIALSACIHRKEPSLSHDRMPDRGYSERPGTRQSPASPLSALENPKVMTPKVSTCEVSAAKVPTSKSRSLGRMGSTKLRSFTRASSAASNGATLMTQSMPPHTSTSLSRQPSTASSASAPRQKWYSPAARGVSMSVGRG